MSEQDFWKKNKGKTGESGAREESPAAEEALGDSGPIDDGRYDLSVQPEQLSKLQIEKDELTRTLVQRQADFENYKKRIERDRIEESRRGVSRLVEDMLPVLDGFARALQAHADPTYEEYRKGLELIFRQLWDALSRHGLERIDAAGKMFDPHFHQAIERVETKEQPDGSVVDVLQEGYLFFGRVLRPSIVRVAVDPQDTGEEKSSPVRHQAH